MIDWRETRRRWVLATVSLAIAAVLMRPQLSSMLVSRGDALAFAGNVRAESFYLRALALDPRNDVAADRIMFHAILTHDPRQLDMAVTLADRLLAGDSRGPAIAMDRALCLQLLHRYKAAMMAFAAVGTEDGDARAFVFAADDAAKFGAKERARRYAAMAHRIDPRFAPARRAFERYGRV